MEQVRQNFWWNAVDPIRKCWPISMRIPFVRATTPYIPAIIWPLSEKEDEYTNEAEWKLITKSGTDFGASLMEN